MVGQKAGSWGEGLGESNLLPEDAPPGNSIQGSIEIFLSLGGTSLHGCLPRHASTRYTQFIMEQLDGKENNARGKRHVRRQPWRKMLIMNTYLKDPDVRLCHLNSASTIQELRASVPMPWFSL